MLNHPSIQRVLFSKESDPQVLDILSDVQKGHNHLSRHLGGEAVVNAAQRLLIFLGWCFVSTANAIQPDRRPGTVRRPFHRE